jgi:sugar phosphate isomerase/epimerase
MSAFALATEALAGPLAHRLAAMRAAGFTRTVLSAGDLGTHPDGWDDAVRCVRASTLRVVALRELPDMRGLASEPGRCKAEMAQAMLETCGAVGTRVLVAASGASSADLRKLAMLAVPMGVKIACREDACEAVMEADRTNLGLCLDAGMMSLDDLELLDMERVFLVRLPDGVRDEPAAATFVRRLQALGYRGAWSLGARNGGHDLLPPRRVAQLAFAAAQWVEDSVLHNPVSGRRACGAPPCCRAIG